MRLSDFDFDLPEALIATRPAQPRTAARLLVAEGAKLTDARVDQITRFLRPGDRLVLNNTKVIPARLSGMRHRTGAEGPTAARIEVTLLAPQADGSWAAMAKPAKKVRDGESIVFSSALQAQVLGRADGQIMLQFNVKGGDLDAQLAEVGAMPLPPYIAAKRAPDAQDTTDYQTVFARHSGAVAAPTASLHFDDALLRAIADLGVSFTEVTLHVGAGTFLPVKADDIRDHKMHSEWGQVSAAAAAEIAATQVAGGRVIPVGTTALRLIETAARATGAIQAWDGDTDIFITPGFDFRVADGLMTNFHLPKSTLMMLVAALMGQDQIREIYRHAIEAKYRFFSYGDSSLLIPS